MLKLEKIRAGLYSADLGNGAAVDVELITTVHGDTGWVWWLGRPTSTKVERSGYRFATKREAVESLESVLKQEGLI